MRCEERSERIKLEAWAQSIIGKSDSDYIITDDSVTLSWL